MTSKQEKRGTNSVTRLGDLLDFGQLFKALATINLPKSPTFLGNFCKGVKIFNFSNEIIFGQLVYTHGDFYWSHWVYKQMWLSQVEREREIEDVKPVRTK